jgi:hypothetical protein
MNRAVRFRGLANNRMQAPACGLAVLGRRIGRLPAAPDAERWADRNAEVKAEQMVRP